MAASRLQTDGRDVRTQRALALAAFLAATQKAFCERVGRLDGFIAGGVSRLDLFFFLKRKRHRPVLVRPRDPKNPTPERTLLNRSGTDHEFSDSANLHGFSRRWKMHISEFAACETLLPASLSTVPSSAF